MRISDIVDTVPVRNRFTKSIVSILHDGVPVEWAPGEVKHLPRQYADFFLRKSTLKTDFKGKAKVQALVVVGSSKPQEPLDDTEYAGPRELIDRTDMPATVFGSDGEALTKTAIVPINGIPGVSVEEQRITNKEEAAERESFAQLKSESADRVADIIEKADDETIAALDDAAQAIATGKAKQIAKQIGA